MNKKLLTALFIFAMLIAFAIPAMAEVEESVPEDYTIDFPGVEGVTVEYYAGSWVSVGAGYDNTASFSLDPTVAKNISSLRVKKDGMYYQIDGLRNDMTREFDIPVGTIKITGVSSDCNLSIVQSNWVYQNIKATPGVTNTFNVFDNNRKYEVRVSRAGYANISIPDIDADGDVYLDIFYNITIPEGVTNIRIANTNWVDTTVWYANYMKSNVITLMKNNGNAKLYFDYNGQSFSKDFILDGSNPFDLFTYTLNFPGVEGVKLSYYKNLSWTTLSGTFNNTGSIFMPSGGIANLRAAKGAMTYQFDGVKAAGVFDVPVKQITVTGISSACELAIVQSDWVYGRAAAAVGVPNVFNVFDNGRTYEVRVYRTGYNYVSVPGKNAGDNVYLDIFYNITIPEGVSNIRISNADWVETTVWYANYLESDVITLMKNFGSAKLHFTYEGKNYTYIPFILNGTNPFNMIVEINKIIAPTCSLEGYTITYINILTGEKWYADYVSALGHTYEAPDHHEPYYNKCYIICEVCDWRGYIDCDCEEKKEGNKEEEEKKNFELLAVEPIATALLTVTYPSDFGGNVQIRQEGLGNWNDYGPQGGYFQMDNLIGLQLEKGIIAAGPVSVRVIIGGDRYYELTLAWDGESNIDFVLTDDHLTIINPPVVTHTVRFRVFDGDYNIGFTQSVVDGGTIDWEAVYSHYEGMGFAIEGKMCFWCDDANGNPLWNPNMEITSDLTLFPRMHAFESEVTTPATCTEDGLIHNSCSYDNCWEYYDDVIAALGHDYVPVVTDPTCTVAGWTVYTCSRCDDSYESNKVDSLGHSWDNGVVTTPVTCENDGWTKFTCSRCEESYDDKTDRLGHDWDAGVVTKEATYEEEGVMTFTCQREGCDHTKTEPIPKPIILPPAPEKECGKKPQPCWGWKLVKGILQWIFS